MYADTMTDSMKAAIEETNRRRTVQQRYNEEHHITPTTIKKAVRDLIAVSKDIAKKEKDWEKDPESMSKKELGQLIDSVEKQMKKAAADLNFEAAAKLRDKMIELKKELQKMEDPAPKRDVKKYIRIRGASENNLKHVDVDIPRNELVVLTGLSGSGKSSLAFDTIYAEGQRRYMESLSSYARQFLGQMEKPKVDSIEGLPPAISIDQKSTNHNPRSTVGTVTEIYDYFRLLYARCGTVHCPTCGREIKKQTVDQMTDAIMKLPERSRIQLLAPVVSVRVRIDGNLYELSEQVKLDKNVKHNIEILVDRLIVKPGIEKRLTESLEQVLALADGLAYVEVQRPKTEKDLHPDEIGRVQNHGTGMEDTAAHPASEGDVQAPVRAGARAAGDMSEEAPDTHKETEMLIFSENFSCPYDGTSIAEIEPRSFSFNNPYGACPECGQVAEH